MRKALILAAAVALLAGCGGGGGSSGTGTSTSTSTKQAASAISSSPGGASVAPASAALLLRIDTAFDSAQWQAFDALLQKFPDGNKLFSSIAGKGVDFERDIKPAVGPELDYVALTADQLDSGSRTFIALTQPRDEAKFQSLLAKSSPPAVSEQIGDWRVIADTRATIDRFKQARNGGTLADAQSYKDASSGLPADALATLYMSGAALTQVASSQANAGGTPTQIPGVDISWLSGAATAKDNGFAVDLRVKGAALAANAYKPALPAEVPADVSLFLDFKGLDAALDQLRKTPALSKQLAPVEQGLGGILDEVIGLFANEGAVYVREQATGTEYVLVLEVADEQGAVATLDRLATLASALSSKAPESITIAGVPAKKLALGTNAVYYAVFDGKLVITNAQSGIEGLKSGGDRLADSQAWKDANEAAGAPDTATGLLYADVQRVVPVIEKLSTKNPLPAQAKRNLAPLGTALLFGSVDGGVLSLKGFVSVR